MTTEVILYRNPGEQAVWNLLMGPFGMWLTIIIISVVAGGVTFVLIEGMVYKRTRKRTHEHKFWRYLRERMHIVKYVSWVVSVLTFIIIAYPIV